MLVYDFYLGSPVNYTNWCPNRKSNFNDHNDEDCAVFVPYLNHGQWDDIMCGLYDSLAIVESLFEKHPYICQFGKTTTQCSLWYCSRLCLTDSKIYSNNIFKLSLSNNKLNIKLLMNPCTRLFSIPSTISNGKCIDEEKSVQYLRQ